MDEERKTREYLLKVLCFQYKAILVGCMQTMY